MYNSNNPTFSCKIWTISSQNKDKAVQSDLGDLNVYIKCNSFNYLDYRYLQNFVEQWYYIECCSEIRSSKCLFSNKNLVYCDNNDGRIRPKELKVDQNYLSLL